MAQIVPPPPQNMPVMVSVGGPAPIPAPAPAPAGVPVPVPPVMSPLASPPPGSNYASTSLYIGDLDQSVTESQLYDAFNQIGQVVSVRVCRDLVSRWSLGYAYVNYNNVQDASRALELLNFTLINGKPIRIMYSHRDPSLRKSGAANIFIKNLETSIDNKALHDTFSVFGPILSCKVAMDNNGQSKGYGFVQFEQEESAQNAIEKVNGMLINDKQVYVGPFVRRQEREGPKFNNIYVKNLSELTTDEDLKKEFGVFGPISSAVVMRDAEGKSKGFGFVNFEDADDAAKAVDNLNGKKFNDKEWYVGRAQKKSEREAELRLKFESARKERLEQAQGINLYLKNLDDDIDDDKLREMFCAYGAITSCKVMKDNNGKSKGSGFVAFASPEDSNRALNEMNGKMVGTKPLYVAFAQRKEERQARLQAHFAQMRNVVGHAPPALAPNPPMYHSAPGIGQQVFYGQPPGLIAQPPRFGYQQPMVPGLRPNFFMPVVQRPLPQVQRAPAGRRAGMGPLPQQQPQMFPRGGSRGPRYLPQSARNPDASMQGLGGGFGMSVPPEMGGSMPIPINALASATPEQQRVMLGEQLYPLVDELEHDNAGKVTGMLLELDQTEVLHLIESPEALKAKVAEAMDVLRHAQSIVAGAPADQLAALSLMDSLSH